MFWECVHGIGTRVKMIGKNCNREFSPVAIVGGSGTWLCRAWLAGLSAIEIKLRSQAGSALAQIWFISTPAMGWGTQIQSLVLSGMSITGTVL